MNVIFMYKMHNIFKNNKKIVKKINLIFESSKSLESFTYYYSWERVLCLVYRSWLSLRKNYWWQEKDKDEKKMNDRSIK